MQKDCGTYKAKETVTLHSSWQLLSILCGCCSIQVASDHDMLHNSCSAVAWDLSHLAILHTANTPYAESRLPVVAPGLLLDTGWRQQRHALRPVAPCL